MKLCNKKAYWNLISEIWEAGRLPVNCMIFCVNRCTNFNASLIFGLATPIELYTFERNLPDFQTNPPWKYIEIVGISVISPWNSIPLLLSFGMLVSHEWKIQSWLITHEPDLVQGWKFSRFFFLQNSRFSSFKKKSFWKVSLFLCLHVCLCLCTGRMLYD